MISIYYKTNEDTYVEVSKDDFSSPINTSHEGKTGTVETKLLYLRNDSSSKYYTSITISPLDTDLAGGFSDLIYEETGWGIKLSNGGTLPSNGEWGNIEWGNSISMGDIGSLYLSDTTTYFPFWYMISSPPNIDAQIKKDIVLVTTYTENAVEV